MADVLNIGTSALVGYQRALTTVSNNIANVNQEGYSRQRTEFVTQTPSFIGVGYLGNGSRLSNVTRSYDQFIHDQVLAATNSFNQLDKYNELVSKIDDLLGNQDSSLSRSLSDFFNSVQDMADDPTSIPARQVLLDEGGALVGQFEFMSQTLNDFRDNAYTDMQGIVDDINTIAGELANINLQILNAPKGSNNAEPNDLLDQRDQMVKELSELVAVRTIENSDGTINVFVGNGQAMVTGTSAQSLTLTPNAYDGSRFEISYQLGGSNVPVTSQLEGGQLGGIIDYLDNGLTNVENSLGRIALVLADTFNGQHALGQDLDDNLGGDFFTAVDSSGFQTQVFDHVNNGTTGLVSVTYNDVSSLTSSDYELIYDGANFTLTRLSDGTVTNIAGGAYPVNATVDGMDIAISAAPAAAGDSYLIRPTLLGTSGIDTVLTDPRDIAAAAPVRTTVGGSNTGNGGITQGTVSNTASIPLSGSGGDITLTFDPDALGVGVPGFNVTNGPGGTIAYDPATQSSGLNVTLGGAFNGISFTVSGVPQSGDTFVITDNTGGVSDNRNALLLADLQNQKTVEGNSTFLEGYTEVLGEVGSITRRSEISRNAQETLLQQAETAREAKSGVNLDEEAADLVRYQQAYQAAAQIINTSNQLFQTLISAIGR